MFKFKELCSSIDFSQQTFIIAEIGQNHQGDISIAKKLIEVAKVSGFQYILHFFFWIECFSIYMSTSNLHLL